MTLAYQEYYTVNDYAQWEGNWELIEGMPYAMSPSPTVSHQSVATKFTSAVNHAIDSKKPELCSDCIVLMETDWQVSKDTIVRPDIMVVCNEVSEKVLVTPILIMEVVSSSSVKRDEVMKFDLYQREGVAFYILAYPQDHLVKIYYNQQGKFIKQQNTASLEKFNFELNNCSFDINFTKIWRDA